MGARGGGPITDARFPKGLDGNVSPAWEVEACVEPLSRIVVYPARPMADSWVEAGIDAGQFRTTKGVESG